MVTIMPPPPIVRLPLDDCPGSLSRNRCIDRKADGATYVKVADTLSSMRKRKEDDRAVKLARARDRIEAENKARVEKVQSPEHGEHDTCFGQKQKQRDTESVVAFETVLA